MKIDFKSLAFGYELESGGGNPAWETSLGQGVGYKLKENSAIDDLVKGMIYKAVSQKTISFKKGKGGKMVDGNTDDSGLVIAAVFDKVFINEQEIQDGKFILLISKDDSKSHSGRLKLKYGIDNTYRVDNDNVIKNQDFIDLAKHQLGLANDACWFIYDISVENQDILRLKATIVNKSGPMIYADSKALHEAWDMEYDSEIDDAINNEYGENIILYGVPGCGKSHTIEEEYCDNEEYMERVVFHPDYTFSDFVGQILPRVEGDVISYPFVEGPFTKILRKAVNDEQKDMYYLVIEEINRGNAPAIFGEIFQLLDRKNGISEYGITNFDIAEKVYGEDKKDKKIRIPANLTILATMNTADQNVFTLDTAFKRRWKMRCIENNFDECDFADNQPICGTSVTWRVFAEKINDAILDINRGSLSNEDARLGAFFVKQEDLCDVRLFSEKVLMYLWTDAFKRDREQVFNPKYRTLEELVKDFRKYKFDVFNPQFGFKNTPISEGNLNVDVKEYLDDKKPELVTLYEQLIAAIGARIENINPYTTNSKQYIGIGTPNCSRKSFAEISIKAASIVLEIEKPKDASLLQLGVDIPYNGSHDHYYKIEIVDDSNIENIVSAVCDSYNQLKKEN